jgi:hypothetical protein
VREVVKEVIRRFANVETSGWLGRTLPAVARCPGRNRQRPALADGEPSLLVCEKQSTAAQNSVGRGAGSTSALSDRGK